LEKTLSAFLFKEQYDFHNANKTESINLLQAKTKHIVNYRL